MLFKVNLAKYTDYGKTASIWSALIDLSSLLRKTYGDR